MPWLFIFLAMLLSAQISLVGYIATMFLPALFFKSIVACTVLGIAIWLYHSVMDGLSYSLKLL